MIYSMTGYASGTCVAGNGILNLEMKTLNSRFLDIQLRLNDELRFAEIPLRQAIMTRLKRGKVDCHLSWKTAATETTTSQINPETLAQLAALSKEITAHFPQAQALSVGEILAWPDIKRNIDPDALEKALPDLLNSTLNKLIAWREKEGRALATIINKNVTAITELANTINLYLPQAQQNLQNKLEQRLLNVQHADKNERIQQEIILFAARIDIAEELNRLQTHLKAMNHLLTEGGTIGKQLDFLTQELQREINTLGAKSPSIEIGKITMEIKLLLEQIREQTQNLE